MSLLYEPVFYGIEDFSYTSVGGQSHQARLYYPALDGTVHNIPILPGNFPLVSFAHGFRTAQDDLCPRDTSQDYQAWDAVLHLLARCGIVVVSPDLTGYLDKPDVAAEIVENAILWVYTSWQYQNAIQGSKLGLSGHSWGARACARVALRKQFPIACIACIAGQGVSSDLQRVQLPTFLIGGTDDLIGGPSRQQYQTLTTPKHEAAIQGTDHWSYFGHQGAIQPCNPQTRPHTFAAQITREMLVTFFYKYLTSPANKLLLPPSLLPAQGQRPDITACFAPNSGCALQIRWRDPMNFNLVNFLGKRVLGEWTEAPPW